MHRDTHGAVLLGDDGVSGFVRTFVAATVGLGPVFDPANPLALRAEVIAAYAGSGGLGLQIDTGQLRSWIELGVIAARPAVVALTQMLVISAADALDDASDKSPPFELLRHLRNAAAHGNKFNFSAREPRRPASWRHLTLDPGLTGSANPAFGQECVGTFAMPADVLLLVAELAAIARSRSDLSASRHSS